MKGFAQRRIDKDGWEIALIDKLNGRAVTIQFIEWTDIKPLHQIETTFIPHDSMDTMKALAQALQEMGVLQENGTTSELRATKYHLEDMRKLALPPNEGKG